VLTAETAAGKSTAVPVSLLDRVGGKILMLEPRRLAAVAIADRVASILGEETGETAGYRMHLDSKISSRTRLEIITEAILTRRIQGDPSLAGVSVVIIDEFHERSVHADLALALLREVMELRDDLFVIVMSATIDTERIAAYLGAPVLRIPGRRWPIDTVYRPGKSASQPEDVSTLAARAAIDELSVPGGNILVFLPGLREIRRAEERLSGLDTGSTEVLILHGSLSIGEQRCVLAEPDGKRRIILSSAIAETSLTVPGVSVVIDSGLARVNRYDVATGMERLVTETESVFSAEQRAGRAGRLGPGRCVRLWAERDVRVAAMPAEILRCDLMPLVLECALWGATESAGLSWLDSPSQPAWNAARDLLHEMGALDSGGRVTDRGRAMGALGIHPRLAAVALAGDPERAAQYSNFGDNAREKERFKADLERRLRGVKIDASLRTSGVLALLAGYPDRIARHTIDGVYQFPSGRLAALERGARSATARHPEWIVAPDVDAGEREGRIYSFEELPEIDALQWLNAHAETRTDVSFSSGRYSAGGKVRKIECLFYGKLVLVERPVEPEAGDVARAVCSGVRKEGLAALPWADTSKAYLVRVRFLAHRGKFPDMPPASDDALLANLEDWLTPFIPVDGKLSAELLLDALRYRYSSIPVDREVPVRIELSNGVSRPLLYEELVPGAGPVPVLETRVQDLYGCAQTPSVAGVPVLLRLLSPARRPVQITSDLAGFWKTGWAEVRKELKGRYPKHDWPENPLSGR
jgi:ATP-dependent helicase HrpB